VTEWAGLRLKAVRLEVLERLADEITQARRSKEGVPVSLEKNRVFQFTIYRVAYPGQRRSRRPS
jgi:ArsR family metal-binding transcriptional regulator